MTDPADSSPLARLRIVLSRPSHPGNIGSAARAMKTMGLSDLVLVVPKAFPDPQAEAMASGAVDILAAARVCTTLEEALADTVFATAVTARRRELAAAPLWAHQAVAELVAKAAGGARVALVFGNETFGLSNQEVALCQRWSSIPANPEYSSLNLAQAVQVFCYEARTQALLAGAPPVVSDAGVPATHAEVEGLLGHLERAAIISGYLDPDQPRRFMPRLRRLFGRAALEREEIHLLRGVLGALLSAKKGA
ncbi:MAG: RNA methyltransferase [Proteobacteria bacterium]|nr:RNA methyltransferase [Pseudomonadota bacterium]HQR03184.1 RNA methyltransferase [Rhodocyclaceae bacterium]